MTTPIYDFVRKYADSDAVRMHMPGHKGVQVLGCEPNDLTEIDGADELFAPTGIIAKSEANASKIFGCETFFSTEGSSLCIRAMLYMAMQFAAENGRKPIIFAARNVHKTFLTTAALLDFEVQWLPQDPSKEYLSASIDWNAADELISNTKERPCALYLTSPDYLGNIADIRAAASFCHSRDMLLLVDNAHGAYLKFLPESLHPIDLGADLCCDSAHKTMPVLTGGAYLHIAPNKSDILRKYAKSALSLFASTSPSYLILASLDRCNAYLESTFVADLNKTILRTKKLRDALKAIGWTFVGNEPMKLTIRPKPYGYTGTEVADICKNTQIYGEFADPDNFVLMPSTGSKPQDFERIHQALCQILPCPAISDDPPCLIAPESAMTPRDALFSPTEDLPIAQCKGRICAEFAVSCPPAVPIVMAGERIEDESIAAMHYYGKHICKVVK